MKIHFDFRLSSDDYEQLTEDFETVEFIESSDIEDTQARYEQVMVDTEELEVELFEDWIEKWLNAGYSLSFNDGQYVIK